MVVLEALRENAFPRLSQLPEITPSLSPLFTTWSLGPTFQSNGIVEAGGPMFSGAVSQGSKLSTEDLAIPKELE